MKDEKGVAKYVIRSSKIKKGVAPLNLELGHYLGILEKITDFFVKIVLMLKNMFYSDVYTIMTKVYCMIHFRR